MQLTVNQRLIAIIAGAIVALLATGLIGFLGSQRLSETLRHTDQTLIHSLATLSGIERDFLLIRVNALYHLSYDRPERKVPHERIVRRNIESIEKQLQEYAAGLAVTARDRELLQRDRQLFEQYRSALEKVLSASNSANREAAVLLIESEWKPAGERLTLALAEHARYKERLVEQMAHESMQSGQRNSLAVLIATLAGIVLVTAAGLLLKRNLAAL
ncbi:MCP four helix bundle domain-containing protein [Chitiniphilus purpureus]|uniref:MCP four helix bundle domain-containing protein n=1 Tax=Chitiniphilus purpureus TaxID=2981137 RepID=A0ABY6DR69_9NEIS|nr:MCP four helix bundle domain-containing protein [Chitiniphilus sp. CD1]UXY16870.1 MCP four helix bundle domain-containing protein [Chitiniphilus sp. CD1]